MKEYSFVDIKKEWNNNELKENIYCFYWELDNRKYIKKYDIIENKDYYFYIAPEEKSTAEMLGLIIYPEIYKTINGKECIKVAPTKNLNTNEYKELRSSFETTYESDVKAITRWIASNRPKYSKLTRNIYIDIETIKNDNGVYGSVEHADAPIISIACYDNFTKKYSIFLYKDSTFFRDDTNIIKCKNEKDMINEFIFYLQYKKPDYLLGWNIESYDIPYIINRMNNLGLDKNKLSILGYTWMKQTDEISSHKFSSFYINITGLGIFDLMAASQRLWLGKYCGYSLNNMSKEYLKETKVEIDEISDLYKNDINKLIEYTWKDVELCVKLDSKLELFNKFQSYQDIISTNVNTTLIQSNNIYHYIWQHTDRVLLNSNKKIDDATFEGGIVTTIPGIYKNSYKFDFASMYPSIIIAYNISNDSILESKKENCINMDNKYFFSKEEGIITKIVKELYERRNEYKKEKNTDLSLAYKLLLNSIYGNFSAPYSRMFDFTCGQAITYEGRRLLNNVKNKLELELNGRIILSDTDSIIFNSQDIIKTDTILEKINQVINIIYEQDSIVDNKIIKMELEKVIDKLIIFGTDERALKKKYVEFYDNQIKIVGVDCIKSDTSEIARDMQLEMIDYVIKNDKITRIKLSEILNSFYTRFIKEIANKNYKYIAIPAKLNKGEKTYASGFFAIKALKNSNLIVSLNERFYIIMSGFKPYGFKSNKDFESKNFPVNTIYMWDRVKKKSDIFFNLLPSEQRTLF